MGQSDNIPGNVNTNQFDLNNGGWILIAVLLCIIVALFITLIIQYFLSQKKINKLEEFYKKELNEKEKTILSQYRKLNSKEQTIIEDTLKTLTKNTTDNEHKGDGN